MTIRDEFSYILLSGHVITTSVTDQIAMEFSPQKTGTAKSAETKLLLPRMGITENDNIDGSSKKPEFSCEGKTVFLNKAAWKKLENEYSIRLPNTKLIAGKKSPEQRDISIGNVIYALENAKIEPIFDGINKTLELEMPFNSALVSHIMLTVEADSKDLGRSFLTGRDRDTGTYDCVLYTKFAKKMEVIKEVFEALNYFPGKGDFIKLLDEEREVRKLKETTNKNSGNTPGTEIQTASDPKRSEVEPATQPGASFKIGKK